MKKFFILFLLIAAKFVEAQSLDSLALKNYDQNIRTSTEYFEYQNWMEEKYSLPEGIYYQFVGRIVIEEGEKIFYHLPARNPERFFGFLVAFGIPLKEAYYRQHESNCRGFEVVIDPSLLIRTDQKLSDKFMEELGFVYTDHPSVGECPYNVRHYIFRQEIEP
jgi:hypothetical protein